MKNERLLKIHETCISGNIPFVTFRMPRQVYSTTYIQKTPENGGWRSVRDISSQTGFIMAPFDTSNGKKYFLVKPDIVINDQKISAEQMKMVAMIKRRDPPLWNGEFPVVTGREDYMSQVDDIKSSISTGGFQKAVLSRIEVIEGDYFSIVPKLFQSICKKHPNAFVYLFKNEKQFWIGASPEPLIRLSDGEISTVSLAGTRPLAEKHMDINKWTAKEVLEQEYVTRYIHDVLRVFNVRDYKVTSPYVKKAGNLLHLRTDFAFGFDMIKERLWEFIDAMHPTPAVAGQPKDDAIAFIRRLEPHDREYYSGFLGPVGEGDTIDLFVNLRCIKITPGYLSLYIGGGITLDSDPSDEWDETRWKAESLLKILRGYIKNWSDDPT